MDRAPLRNVDVLCISSAAAVVCLGLAVIVGWHAGLARLIQLHPTFAPMQYNTALAFTIAGLGAITVHFSRRAGSLLGLAALAIGFVSLLQYALGTNFGIDELLVRGSIMTKTSHAGRMSPQTALGFTLAGLALVTLGLGRPSPSRTFAVELLCSLFGALGTAAVIGYLTGVEPLYGWTEMTRMALHTSIGFILLATSVFRAVWRLDRIERAGGSRLLAYPVAIGGLVLTLVLFRTLFGWQEQRVNELSMQNANRTVADLDARLSRYLEGFSAVAEQWGRTGGEPQPSWEGDVARFLRDHDVFQAIALGGSDGRLRWIFPGEPFASYVGLDFAAEHKRLAALTMAREQAKPIVSGAIELTSGSSGIIFVAPLPPSTSEPSSFIVGAIRIEDLFRASVLALPGYDLGVYEGEALVYTTKAAAGAADGPPRGGVARLDDLPWRVVVTPLTAAIPSGASLPIFVLALGLLVTALVALTVHLAQVALRRTHELARSNETLLATQKQLQQLALFDNLTGLGNRNLFIEQFDHLIEVASRESKPLPVLLIDLDGFKRVNDQHGHEAGDLVLGEVGALLRAAIRTGDQAFRIGGDEFSILLAPGTPVEGAVALANKIAARVGAMKATAAQGYIVGVSIGIAVYPEHGRERDKLLRNADAAMYRAKHDRTTIAVADDTGATAVLAALNLASRPR